MKMITLSTVLAVLFILLVLWMIHTRNKHYKEYVARKEHDQRYITGDRKGVKW